MKINLPVFKDEDMKDLLKLALGLDGVSPCGVMRLHLSPLCYLLPAGLSGGVG